MKDNSYQKNIYNLESEKDTIIQEFCELLKTNNEFQEFLKLLICNKRSCEARKKQYDLYSDFFAKAFLLEKMSMMRIKLFKQQCGAVSNYNYQIEKLKKNANEYDYEEIENYENDISKLHLAKEMRFSEVLNGFFNTFTTFLSTDKNDFLDKLKLITKRMKFFVTDIPHTYTILYFSLYVYYNMDQPEERLEEFTKKTIQMMKKKKWSFWEIYNCLQQYLDIDPKRKFILILLNYLQDVSLTKNINSIDQYEILNNFIFEYTGLNGIMQANKTNRKLTSTESMTPNTSLSMNNEKIFKSLRNKHQYAKKMCINEETIKQIQEIQRMSANCISSIKKGGEVFFRKQNREILQVMIKISKIMERSNVCDEKESNYINFCIRRIGELKPYDEPGELPLIYYFIVFSLKTPRKITPSISKLIEVSEDQFEKVKNKDKITNTYLAIVSFSRNKNVITREKAANLIKKMEKEVWQHMESKINFLSQTIYTTLNFFDIDFKFLETEILKPNKKTLHKAICLFCHTYF